MRARYQEVLFSHTEPLKQNQFGANGRRADTNGSALLLQVIRGIPQHQGITTSATASPCLRLQRPTSAEIAPGDLFPGSVQELAKLLLSAAVFVRKANRNASPIGVGRKGTADFDASRT